jgi:acetylornithine deacetylase/succinyl-diaminopimelate desuccinylase-like protein
MKQKIHDYFAAHEQEIRQGMLALLAEMVRERTVNVVTEKLAEHPYLKLRGEEYRVARIVKQELERLGIPYDEHARLEGRPNVIGKLGRDESGERLFMAAHMDIVPAGEGWSTPPFEMTMKGDTALGRGVLDNKGPLAAILTAARILKEVVGGEAIRGQLQIAALADEEATDPDGVDYGIGFLIDEKKINPTMAIIPDIGENMKDRHRRKGRW